MRVSKAAGRWGGIVRRPCRQATSLTGASLIEAEDKSLYRLAISCRRLASSHGVRDASGPKSREERSREQHACVRMHVRTLA